MAHLTRVFFMALLGAALLALAGQAVAQQQPGYSSRDAYGPKAVRKSGKSDFNPNTVRTFKPKTAKDIQKIEKMKSKPQYADPMYFGHKKPPKKRPPGKQKYCKECGMRH